MPLFSNKKILASESSNPFFTSPMRSLGSEWIPLPKVINEPPQDPCTSNYPMTTILSTIAASTGVHAADLTDIRNHRFFDIFRAQVVQKVSTQKYYRDLVSYAYGGEDKVADIFRKAKREGYACRNFIFIVFFNALSSPRERDVYSMDRDKQIWKSQPKQTPVQRALVHHAPDGKVHHKDMAGLGRCLIRTSGQGLKCGFFAMASGIAQLSKVTRDALYADLGAGRIKGDLERCLAREGVHSAKYQKLLGEVLFQYSKRNYGDDRVVLTERAALEMASMAYMQAEREYGNGTIDVDVFRTQELGRIQHMSAVAARDMDGDINVAAERIRQVARLLHLNVIFNEGDVPSDGQEFVHIFNLSGMHYSAVNKSKVYYGD